MSATTRTLGGSVRTSSAYPVESIRVTLRLPLRTRSKANLAPAFTVPDLRPVGAKWRYRDAGQLVGAGAVVGTVVTSCPLNGSSRAKSLNLRAGQSDGANGHLKNREYINQSINQSMDRSVNR